MSEGVFETAVVFDRNPPSLEEVLEVLRSRREAVRRFRFEIVGVFGSFARGEARPDSDVDIVVKAIDPKAGLLDLGGVWTELSEALGRPVDLLELDAARPGVAEAALRDLAPL